LRLRTTWPAALHCTRSLASAGGVMVRHSCSSACRSSAAQREGVDPVHFGIILVVNLLIGTLTPPFGVILFIMMDIAKISLAQISRAVLPFYIPLFLTLMVITYWAEFVLAVPRFFGKPN
jgi:TRAP-type C4-dicarboxylate transport system permease large subunit